MDNREVTNIYRELQEKPELHRLCKEIISMSQEQRAEYAQKLQQFSRDRKKTPGEGH